MQVGYLGVGNMGQPMAGKLMDAGHSLVVFDISEAAMEPLLLRQARRAVSPRDLGDQCEIVAVSLGLAAQEAARQLDASVCPVACRCGKWPALANIAIAATYRPIPGGHRKSCGPEATSSSVSHRPPGASLKANLGSRSSR